MSMRGIILAGGSGTRLRPITLGLNKQALPIYDKPMIYYPLATLMAAGMREILIISTPSALGYFKDLFLDGRELGLNIKYEMQMNPTGIADAYTIGKEFVGQENSALILGDNVFHGTGLGRQLMDLGNLSGCQIFAHRVSDPTNYGVIEFSSTGEPVKILEKPKASNSNYAIPGLYFFDNKVVGYAEEVTPSPRGEREITSILNRYLQEDTLKATILPRGTTWLDTGTASALHDASTYVRLVEERQGYKIACIEEIAWRQGWISTDQLKFLGNSLGRTPYSDYLFELVKDEETRTW